MFTWGIPIYLLWDLRCLQPVSWGTINTWDRMLA